MPSLATSLRWIYALGFLWPCGLVVVIGDFILFMMAMSVNRFVDWQLVIATLCLTICGLVITLSPIVLGVLIQLGRRVNMWFLHMSNAVAIGFLFWLGNAKPFESIGWGIILYSAAFFMLGYWLNIINKQHLAENLK